MIGSKLGTRFAYAPDDASSGVDIVAGTLPQDDDGPATDPWSDVELADDSAASVPPELAGKTPAELIAEIERREQEATALRQRVDPASTLAETMQAFMQSQRPAQAPIPEGFRVKQTAPQMTPQDYEKWKKGLADKFLDDPTAATQEVVLREVTPLLGTLAESMASLSRDNARLSPETKDVYAKYAAEIEADVAEIEPLVKLRNPRVYQEAVERARARHFNELVSETTKAQQEAIASEYLKSLGLDIETVKASAGKASAVPASAPAASTLAKPGVQSAPAQTSKTRISLSPQQRAAVEARAKATGMSLEATAAHMRARGLI